MNEPKKILKESEKTNSLGSEKSPFSVAPFMSDPEGEAFPLSSPIIEKVGGLEAKRASYTAFSKDSKKTPSSEESQSPFLLTNEAEADQISILPMPVKDEKGFTPTTNFTIISDRSAQKEPIYNFGSSKLHSDNASQNNQTVANTKKKEVNTTSDSSTSKSKNESDKSAQASQSDTNPAEESTLSEKTTPSGPPKPPPGSKAVVLPATPDITRPYMDDDDPVVSPTNSAGTVTVARSAVPSARGRQKTSKSQPSKKDKDETSSTPPWSSSSLAPWTPPSEATASTPETAKGAEAKKPTTAKSTPFETVKPAATVAASSAKPATIPGSDQLVLRALFGVTKVLNKSEIIELGSALPGIKNLDVIPEEQATALDTLRSSMEKLGYTDLGTLALTSSNETIDFIGSEKTIIIVQNEGEYEPGVREKLIIIAQELDKL